MVNTNFDSTPVTPSPETQGKLLAQSLLQKMAEVKKAYDPDRKQSLQTQLQEITQQISENGPQLTLTELDKLKRAAFDEMLARKESGFKGIYNNIIQKIRNPNINDQAMNYGWQKLPAPDAVRLFQEQPMRQALKATAESTQVMFSNFKQEDIQLQLYFTEKLGSISEAIGYVTALSSVPQSEK